MAQTRSQAPFVLYSCLTALFGVLNAITGPVLPDFESQAGVDSVGIGAIFVYRGVGSMLGGFAIGFVLDAVRNPHSVLIALLSIKALMELTLPYGSSVVMLGTQFAVMAFCGNAIATVCTTSVSWTYGKLLGVQMNVMNAVFGLGASFAPMLTAIVRDVDSHAVHAYWIIAACDFMLIAAAASITAAENPSLTSKGTSIHASGGYVELHERNEVDRLAVALCGAAVLFAGVCEATVVFWLFSYSTQQLHLSVHAAEAVNTCFFVTFTATRFLCGWLVTKIGAASILRWSLAIAFLASLGIIYPHAGAVLACVGMIGVGVGVAPFAANAVTVLGQTSFISGRASGVMRVMAAFGAMIGSSGTGFLQKWPLVADRAMPTMVFSGLICLAFVTAALLRRCR
eukprot:TRINITY_DN26881_c0_g1_i1.p1 TRINITY_DN26881_c0_g1~~TRINITY_DN26881_c0_g1_i1.p1  ORF type:complete len:408 (-),score=50.02 TRINITY_DN26881_c0_g1_i1:218-1411(-)